MQGIFLIENGFRIVYADREFVWTKSDLPSQVLSTADRATIEDWMNANLPDLVGAFVRVVLTSVDPFVMDIFISQTSAIQPQLPHPPTPDFGG